ncbi:MAG: hypothetical protein U5L08_00180 [Xanthomonadales bacterium]|nr:hypothetical protein [Xanthomonadales bacterium]
MPSKSRTVVLIACSSRKLDRPARAGHLYQGTLFRASLDWARRQAADAICILSAKYGLVALDQVIKPYDLTLNDLPVVEIRAWSERVLDQLASRFDLERDRFVFLAGERYRRFLVPRLTHAAAPLARLKIGEQVSWLQRKVGGRHAPRPKDETAGSCQAIHDWANAVPRHELPMSPEKVPRNGLYIVFERGERAHGGDRIVRIGTHTGNGNLPGRLREHFIAENKDRSIFRKNIGRALLGRDGNHRLLEQWNLDLTSRAARERFGDDVDRKALREVEARVSDYIRERFSFAVIEEPNRARRLQLEKELIGTVAQCPECGPSESWPGRHSPVERIRESGLWLTQHLGARPMASGATQKLRSGEATTRSDETRPRPTSARTTQSARKRKYGALHDFLQTASDVVDLSFVELERILGAPLPASARDYRPWWANHEGANKSPQSRAWQSAGYRVDGVKLGERGSVRFVRIGGPEASGEKARPPTAKNHGQISTHGGRARSFEWSLDHDTLRIESESGMSHAYDLAEILGIIRLLQTHFRSNWFPLANNVEKLHHGTERYGLGGAIHQQRPGDTLHAQGASYLGVVLERADIFEWNGKARAIQWRIRHMPDDAEDLRVALESAAR